MSKREKAYKSSSRIVGQLLEAAYSISRLLRPRRSGLAIAASFTSALNWSAGNADASKAALESGAVGEAGVYLASFGAVLGGSNFAAKSGHSVSITSCISSLIAVKAPSSFDGMSNDRIEFIVRYLNGGEARIWIPRWNLQRGDHVAQLIAGEKQRAG